MIIISGAIEKPAAANMLKEIILRDFDNIEGYLYLGFPVMHTQNGPFALDAIMVSKKFGIIILQLIEGSTIEHYEEVQDDCYMKMQSKLMSSKNLTAKKKLLVPIHVMSFAPMVREARNGEYPLCNEQTLSTYMNHLPQWDGEKYEETLSVIQSVSSIRERKQKRSTKKENSKGAKLALLENTISTLDAHQSEAVIETVEGVQRIRGLAGSGKTIVLALKAVYLHATYPEWKIAITFNTRSLKEQFKNVIYKFCIEQTAQEPNWDNLHILNAWGAPGTSGRNGMYSKFCLQNDVPYFDFERASAVFGKSNAFHEVCEKALQDALVLEPEYDAILIDEAQDFSTSFLRLCYANLKTPKRLVYAYDELQSLNENTLPSPEELFGKDEQGHPLVSFDVHERHATQDIILKKCYRNSRQALVSAHALGFGIYRQAEKNTSTGIIQMFENKQLWYDIGYRCIKGDMQDGKEVILQRSEDTSPLFLETHSKEDDLISFTCFDNQKAQDEWVVAQIIQNLKEDELVCNDIIVIHPDPKTTRMAVTKIRKYLYENTIQSHVAGVDTSTDVFFKDDSVTFTGIFRAKGNEAAMVYVINAQDCYYSFGALAKVRNELFTAITRSKAWVRVCGYGEGMKLLKQEFECVKRNKFQLDFVYPTMEQRKHMNIVNRDMSEYEKNRVLKGKQDASSIAFDIMKGTLHVEDLDEETIEIFRSFFGGSGDA